MSQSTITLSVYSKGDLQTNTSKHPDKLLVIKSLIQITVKKLHNFHFDG